MSSSTSPVTSIEDLPPEMICELFKHLHPRDLATCSQVNKRWNSLYSSFKVDSLVAVGAFDLILDQWCYPVRKIENRERCGPVEFVRLTELPLLSNLKHLALCGFLNEFDFNLNQLNYFVHLVHLELNLQRIGSERVHFNFPKLKVLAFHQPGWDAPLSIDCPELNVLVYYPKANSKSLLDVKHPESIRKLDTNMFGPKLSLFKTFKNVEYLVARQFSVIHRDILQSLPKLKELHYKASISAAFQRFSHEDRSLDRMKQTLNEFLDEAMSLRGREFQFNFAGFPLTKTKLDQINFDVQETGEERRGEGYVVDEHVYMKNYELIEPGALDFVDRLYYPSLIAARLSAHIPTCFSEKFTNVKSVCVMMWKDYVTAVDVTHFLRFLKSLSFLRSLNLSSVSFDQEVYDQLPASAPLLNQFLFSAKRRELKLNFDFIDELSHIKQVCIYYYSPDSMEHGPFQSIIRLISRTFCKLEDSSFQFPLGRKKYYILKGRSSKEWSVLEDFFKIHFQTKKLDELLDFLEALRNGSS